MKNIYPQAAVERTTPKKRIPGAASFCVPRAALEVLLHEAALVIISYFILAFYSDRAGTLTAASVSAIHRRTGCNKGRIAAALQRLQTLRATAHGVDLGPLVVRQDLPVPAKRSDPRYRLPDFGEKLADRVWFGGELVTGDATFRRPMAALMHAGDAAARALLRLYLHDAYADWGGVLPLTGPWVQYVDASAEAPLPAGASGIPDGVQVLYAQRSGLVEGRLGQEADPSFARALDALRMRDFVAEAVVVLDRAPDQVQLETGVTVAAIASDASPYYPLGLVGPVGDTPAGEEGLAKLTATTAADLGLPVALPERGGRKLYVAFGLAGGGLMVVGLWRLRFRPTNPAVPAVGAMQQVILQRRDSGYELLRDVRARAGLAPLPAPWTGTGTGAGAGTGVAPRKRGNGTTGHGREAVAGHGQATRKG